MSPTVNSLGRAFILSTAGNFWQEINYHDIEFKRVSANEFFTWSIGGDHQIYIYLPIRDVPIRYRVVTYENEAKMLIYEKVDLSSDQLQYDYHKHLFVQKRWNPIHGFSNKLLPTDRPHWSSADGLSALPLDSFKLPSDSWQWEAEWYVEDNLEGQPLEPEGWTYAIDFPASYGPNKGWNSCVRRRKWVRYRRFCAMDKWTLIPSIHEDPVLEPFIDVAVGGTDIPGGEQEKFAVWAVTIMGKVVFRYGVSTISPEGSGWVPVTTPGKCEVNQISVGPTGLLWAVTWEGNALVRIGVTRENIMGKSWLEVSPPSEHERLLQISVGTNAVWGVSRNRKVWFRKGIKGLEAGMNEFSAEGSGWVEMVGEMMMISTGLNDQVWAIGPDGQNVFLRTGVTHAELSGRTWKPLGVKLHHLNRNPSLSSLTSHSSTSTQRENASSFEESSSIGLATDSKNSSRTNVNSSPILHSQFKNLAHNIPLNVCSSTDFNAEKSEYISSSGESIQNVNIVSSHHISYSRAQNDNIENKLHSVAGDDVSLSDISIDSSYSRNFPSDVWSSMSEKYDIESLYNEHVWLWISASGCIVDSEVLPLWFSKGRYSSHTGPDEPWYENLRMQFQNRHSKEVQGFTSYQYAIEKSTWVKTGTCHWYKDYNWINCLLELEQQGIEQGADRGFLTCHHKKEQHVINLIEITCVVRVNDRARSTLAIHTAKRTVKGKPNKLSFNSDEDLDDWMATLNNSCRSVNDITWKPDKKAMWSTTNGGDVYVSNLTPGMQSKSPSKMLWNLLGGGHLHVVETCSAGITWGLGYNNTAWVYTNGYGGGAYRGITGCNVAIHPMSDTKYIYIYENQRWNPLTGFTAKGLPTDRYMWSDRTGRLECTKENTRLPSGRWQWISDWAIDYKTPGGTDNEGWQYATDFPRSYHAYKSFTDYVRRRRWYRKCRLTTSGPWKQIGTTSLLDISFQVDQSETDGETILTWAVATNGDVLCRIGVSESCPEGTSWVHIVTDQPFRSISVGGDYAVWAIAKDGSAHLRHGISSQCVTGISWFHIEAPQVGCPLRQISAGKSAVFAVDENNRLWSRQEIVPVFKEGTHWKLVSDNVKQVSVGPNDQVWAVMESFETSSGTISGVVCRRSCISEENNIGTKWDQGIGGSWNYLCVRGCLMEGS